MRDSYEDQPVYFPGPGQDLAGVLTMPREFNGRMVLQVWGTAPLPSSGRNRLRTTFARRLAEEGYASLRFDWPGQGESQGHWVPAGLATSYAAECASAATWLRSQGFDRLTILGNCFGGRSALMAGSALGPIEAIATISPPLWREHEQATGSKMSTKTIVSAALHTRPGELADREWRQRRMKTLKGKLTSLVPGRVRPESDTAAPVLEGLRHFLEQQTPVLVITHEGSDFRSDLEAMLERNGVLAQMAKTPPSRLVVLDDLVRGQGSLRLQEGFIAQVRSFLDDLPTVVEPVLRSVPG